MSEPKSAHSHAHLQCTERGIPFVLASKTIPRHLLYVLYSENNIRSSPKEQSVFIIKAGRYNLKLNERLPSKFKREHSHRENNLLEMRPSLTSCWTLFLRVGAEVHSKNQALVVFCFKQTDAPRGVKGLCCTGSSQKKKIWMNAHVQGPEGERERFVRNIVPLVTVELDMWLKSRGLQALSC